MQQIADDVILMSFPFRIFGISFKRNVTLLRLSDGRVVVHYTARFADEDVAAMRRFGEPAWLLDATLMHDTFAKEGRVRSPTFLIWLRKALPRGAACRQNRCRRRRPLGRGKIDGNRMNEHALFHRRSRTLVVIDLFFSFPAETRGWPRFFVRHFMRLPRLFGISAFYRRLVIEDKPAFARSIDALLAFDCDRLIVAHWQPIETEAKRLVERAVAEYRNP
jgi:hypothetical protein